MFRLRIAAALGALTVVACSNSSDVTSSVAVDRSELHKVKVSAAKAVELETQGAKVVADYGSFKLLHLDAKLLNVAITSGDVEVKDEFDTVLLNAGAIETKSRVAQGQRGVRVPTTGKAMHLVQFAGPIQEAWVTSLKALGVQVVAYVPNNAYLVYGDAAAMTNLKGAVTKYPEIQWDGEYLPDYRLDPSVQTIATKAYTIQLVKDDEANAKTLARLASLETKRVSVQEALGYVNVVSELSRADVNQIIMQPDVVSVHPRPEPRRFDERQNVVMIGDITSGSPTGPGYLNWLLSKGFSQPQFTTSGFGVDVTDSGLDNGTQTPNHFGLYVGGNVANSSRVTYSRLEGTPNAGSTIQGCDGHGTLNTHIIGGYAGGSGATFNDAQGFSYGLGLAPFVKVGSSVIFDPGSFTNPDYEDLQSRAYRDGMRISSNSWGAATSGAYTADSQRYDALVRDAQPASAAVPNVGNQQMIIVFAAGNSGAGASTVGSPGTAKNVITAGASENPRAFGAADQCGIADTGADNAYDVISFSSRGPAADGRKKPDLMAPGTHVTGGVAQTDPQRANPPATPTGQALPCFDASGVCGGPTNFFPAGQQWYTASSGTSHSTPAIAGASALVYQYFINNGMSPPSPAMNKAYLMNSARYMTGVGANDTLYSNAQGMGLTDLGRTFDGVARFTDDQNPTNLFTATGQTRTFSGVVGNSTTPFRVTLAWTDAPGSTTGSAWNNNLDLTVTVGGNTYRGNVFTGANSVTGGAADSANNVESVFLPAGVSGPYTVTVTATNINSDGVPGNASALDQDFALVVYNSCNTAPPTVTGVTAAVNGDNRIDINWVTNGASVYRVYRSVTPGGPYTRVGEVAAPPFADIGVSGGTTYYYVVRGLACAESPDSNEASATGTGVCTLPPTFAGLTSATSAGSATCTNSLAWAAASPICGGTLTYSVYRSKTPGFTPSVANRIATGLTGTSFSDDLNAVNGTTYYYVVRATETSSASNEDTNLVTKSARAGGAVVPNGWFDDLDANRPPNAAAYFTAATLTGTAGVLNITTNCHYQSSNKSYRFGAASATCGGAYPVSTTAWLRLGGDGSTAGINGFAIPASAVSPTLTFNVWYIFESQYDGAWLQYSTTGLNGTYVNVGDSVNLTAPYISAGGYDNTLNGSGGVRVWTNSNQGANGALKQVTVDLSALKGQTVWFALRNTSDITITREGIYYDDFRVQSNYASTCTTNVPPPGPAARFDLSLPASSTAGTPVTATLTAYDAVDQVATSYNGTASLTSSDAQATLPPGIVFSGGVATASVTFGTAGAQTLTATDGAVTGTTGTSVVAGPAAKLAFVQNPTSAVAGVALSPAVTTRLTDAYGNAVSGTDTVTLAIGTNAGGGTLSGTVSAASVAGVATFAGLSIDKVGTGYTLTAAAPGLTGATSSTFNITPAAAAKLRFGTAPSNSVAGAAIAPSPTVELVDAFDNLSTSTASVTLALSGGSPTATLGGTVTQAAVAGVATFTDLTVNKVGTAYVLNASSGALTGAASTGFDITPAAPASVKFTTQPSNAVATAALSPALTVTLYDAFANVATQSTATVNVSIASNPSAGTLSGTKSVAAVAGVATFSDLSIDKVGANYTLAAGASGLSSDTSVGFDITVGPAAKLAFVAQPSNAVSQATIAPAVTVMVTDNGGNPVATSTVITLAIANNAGSGTLSGTLSAATSAGVATFSDLSIDKAGVGYTLAASATALTGATSTAFTISAGAATHLAFGTVQSTAVAGASFDPIQVLVQDAAGNVVSGGFPLVTVAFGNNPSGATLGGTLVATAAGGVATFAGLSVNKTGAGYTLSATTPSLTSATSTSFTVTHAAKSQLAYRTGPVTIQAGAAWATIDVEVRDALGNLVDDATDAVTLALSNAPGATLAGTTSVAAVGGVASFAGLSVAKAGTAYTLDATATGLTTVKSSAFDVTVGPAAVLAFATQPTSVGAGQTMPSVVVDIRDAFGNVVTTATDAITLSLGANTTGATLGGTLSVAAVNGVATFTTLTLDKVGTGYTLVANGASLTALTSNTFDVTHGAKAQLAFRTSPTTTPAGSTLAPVQVEIRDALGNLVADATDDVTVTLDNAQGALLSGTTTVAAVGGVATFGTLSIAKAGTGYKLSAGATGVTSAQTAAFDITVGAAAALAFSVQPTMVQAGQTLSPAVLVEVRDAQGNLVTASSVSVTLALGNNPSGGTLGGTLTATAVNGVASFADLTVDKVGTGYTVVASGASLTSATSAAFDVTAGQPASLVFKTNPAAKIEAGKTFGDIALELRDAKDNIVTSFTGDVTVALGANAAQASLKGTLTVAAVAGVATFSDLAIQKAGKGFTLSATASGVAGAMSSAFDIAAGSATTYSVSLPASVTANTEATASATATDAYGNVDTTYAGKAKVTSTDSAATLPADATFAAGQLASLKVTFKTGGQQTLTLTDSVKASVTGNAKTTVTAFAQPVAQITAPTEGQTVSGRTAQVTATGSVSAGTTLTSLSILIDGTQVATAANPSLSYDWDTSKTTNGSHVIVAVVTDSAGNSAQSTPVTVTVKNGGGCGCSSGGEVSMLFALVGLARFAMRRRRQGAAPR